jgi:hypothetical protein
MRRVTIDAVPLRPGRSRRRKSLKATPAEIAIARQMAKREREEARQTTERL